MGNSVAGRTEAGTPVSYGEHSSWPEGWCRITGAFPWPRIWLRLDRSQGVPKQGFCLINQHPKNNMKTPNSCQERGLDTKLFFFNFYLFMIVTERERERGRDTGRGRSRPHAPGARRGIRSRVSRIAPWAKGRRQTAAPPRDPRF